jgi:hypothetical protein
LTHKAIKKLRKQYRQRINSLAMTDLKKEIFRLARNRDILGVLLIVESLIALIFIIATIIR